MRHPDGSSNPELDKIETFHNGHCEDTHFDLKTDPEVVEVDPEQSKPSRRFAFRFLSIFSSSRGKSNSQNKRDDIKRSKSCDRKLEDGQVHPSGLKKNRSSSSSPSLKTTNKLSLFKTGSGCQKGSVRPIEPPPPQHHQYPIPSSLETPSTMSLATEWEFCNNDQPFYQSKTNFENIIIKNNSQPIKAPQLWIVRKGDRKSSGYDSFGNDESSSLDSSRDSQSPQMPKQTPMTR